LRLQVHPVSEKRRRIVQFRVPFLRIFVLIKVSNAYVRQHTAIRSEQRRFLLRDPLVSSIPRNL
jgi:hypothetical protein